MRSQNWGGESGKGRGGVAGRGYQYAGILRAGQTRLVVTLVIGAFALAFAACKEEVSSAAEIGGPEKIDEARTSALANSELTAEVVEVDESTPMKIANDVLDTVETEASVPVFAERGAESKQAKGRTASLDLIARLAKAPDIGSVRSLLEGSLSSTGGESSGEVCRAAVDSVRSFIKFDPTSDSVQVLLSQLVEVEQVALLSVCSDSSEWSLLASETLPLKGFKASYGAKADLSPPFDDLLLCAKQLTEHRVGEHSCLLGSELAELRRVVLTGMEQGTLEELGAGDGPEWLMKFGHLEELPEGLSEELLDAARARLRLTSEGGDWEWNEGWIVAIAGYLSQHATTVLEPELHDTQRSILDLLVTSSLDHAKKEQDELFRKLERLEDLVAEAGLSEARALDRVATLVADRPLGRQSLLELLCGSFRFVSGRPEGELRERVLVLAESCGEGLVSWAKPSKKNVMVTVECVHDFMTDCGPYFESPDAGIRSIVVSIRDSLLTGAHKKIDKALGIAQKQKQSPKTRAIKLEKLAQWIEPGKSSFEDEYFIVVAELSTTLFELSGQDTEDWYKNGVRRIFPKEQSFRLGLEWNRKWARTVSPSPQEALRLLVEFGLKRSDCHVTYLERRYEPDESVPEFPSTKRYAEGQRVLEQTEADLETLRNTYPGDSRRGEFQATLASLVNRIRKVHPE